MSQRDRDASYMQLALLLARRGWGTTAPNPSVGALVVDEANGEVLARAWTRAGGRPHAETEALEGAGARAKGATLYVTLEPCSHHGHTPPCAEAIISAGISRVVCGAGDPDPRVAGRGFDMLRKAGVEVVVGVGETEARWAALGHFLRMREARPFVQLKMAVSADGLIAAGKGAPTWVTGAEARARGHLLRAQADAILVGVGTVLADDPELTCRLPGLEGRTPARVVLDSRLKTPVTAKLLTRRQAEERVLVFSGGAIEAGASTSQTLAEAGATVVTAKGSNAPGYLNLELVLARLAAKGVTRLLVEGGPHVWRSFLDAGFVDEAVIFQGAKNIGPAGLPPLVNRGLDEFADLVRWRPALDRPIGPDRMRVYRNVRHY